MASNVPLTLRQSNDEIISLVITPSDPTDDLSMVTSISVYIKPSACVSDADSSVVTLTSASSSQVTIDSQTSAQITATVYVAAAYLSEPYSRFWRVDVFVGTAKRTAMYGAVTMIDL